MKATLLIPVDTSKLDQGVADLIERHRDIFDSTGGREQIAQTMSRLCNGRKRINRQMVEKWFRPERRTYPSSVLLITLLLACETIKQRKTMTKAA